MMGTEVQVHFPKEPQRTWHITINQYRAVVLAVLVLAFGTGLYYGFLIGVCFR